MSKSIVYLMLLIFMIIFSINTIQASDVDCEDYVKSNDSKNSTDLTSLSDKIYFKGQYKVSLKDTNSNSSLINKTITINVNNVYYNTTTDYNGVASVNLDLSPNKYFISAYFSGDNNYEDSMLNSSVQILPTIKANDITKYYKGTTPYTAVFYKSDGNVLASKMVTIKVNGKVYSKKTNNNGVVSLDVNLKPGSYKIISTDPINNYKLITTFNILSTINGGNIQKFINDNKKFKAQFLKSNGKALSKKFIKFKLKGKTYKVKTNSKGQASLSLKKLKKGTYYVKCYNKDGLSKTFKIQIYKKSATTNLTTNFHRFLVNGNKEIKVRLSTSIGAPSHSGKTIKINIAGTTYKCKTDANGMVFLKVPSLKKGLYKLTCKYSGNKYFKSSKTTNLVAVFDSTDSILTVKSTKSFGHGSDTPFKVFASAGGVPLIKKSVTFTVNNKKYVSVTDNNGIASIPVNLAIGNYTIQYKISSDSIIKNSSGSCDIEVFKRSASKITWKSGVSFKDSSQTFNVLLTDSKNNPIKGELVRLTIDSQDYYDYTSSRGYATFKTSVAIGKYKIAIYFDGDNENAQCSSSKTVNVKLSIYKNGVNEINKISYLKVYHKSSKHCKVGSGKIKVLVKSLTKGLTNKVDKAKAIFNYVRDKLSYSYYYNTRYGALKTLKYKKGNCADHSHLLVSMFRTAGFNARYVHGVCTFSSQRCGHVWTQVLIGKTWVCADAVSYRNSLGKINNWNIKTYSLHSKYASLPF